MLELLLELLGLLASFLLEDPVVLVIILVTTLVHQVLEDLPHVVVVWPLFELEVPAVLKILVELLRKTPGERLNRRCHLLVFDSIVLVIFVFALKALPWQTAFQEVYQNEAYGLEVVSTTLFYAQVGVHGSVTRSSSQRLVVFVRNMLAGFGVSETFGETKVNDIYVVLLLANSNEEVVRLDVSVQEVA